MTATQRSAVAGQPLSASSSSCLATSSPPPSGCQRLAGLLWHWLALPERGLQLRRAALLQHLAALAAVAALSLQRRLTGLRQGALPAPVAAVLLAVQQGQPPPPLAAALRPLASMAGLTSAAMGRRAGHSSSSSSSSSSRTGAPLQTGLAGAGGSEQTQQHQCSEPLPALPALWRPSL